jgi:hypothetical protein
MDLLSLVVVSRNVREAGDLLEAYAKMGKITITPKSAVDRGIAGSLVDFAAGRSRGPFRTYTELIDSLHRESAKVGLKATAAKGQ